MSQDPNEMSCKELVELITDYLEGSLPPRDRIRFEEHLSICSSCRTYLDQMRLTIAAVGNLSEESLPAGSTAELMAVFRDWKRSVSS